MVWEMFAFWVVALRLLRDCGLPDAALCAVRASSIDFPAICSPGAMQNSVRWLARLQLAQIGRGLFVTAASAVLSTKPGQVGGPTSRGGQVAAPPG